MNPHTNMLRSAPLFPLRTFFIFIRFVDIVEAEIHFYDIAYGVDQRDGENDLSGSFFL